MPGKFFFVNLTNSLDSWSDIMEHFFSKTKIEKLQLSFIPSTRKKKSTKSKITKSGKSSKHGDKKRKGSVSSLKNPKSPLKKHKK